jgi:NAD(P)-dependent dehydrogenase (short-subunit alcohol dehydrogenase family)
VIDREFEIEWQGEEKERVGGRRRADMEHRSSKSALHGLVHWMASAYAKSGITVNGVAPALIQETTMLPGNNEELAKSMHPVLSISLVLCFGRWLKC